MRTRAVLDRPLRRLTQGELDAFLEKAADILRGSVDHSEFRGYVFALLFYKRINDVYQEEVRKLLDELQDEQLARDPKMHNFVVPREYMWDQVARRGKGELGGALNDAMIGIERANQPKFDGILTNKIDFNNSDEMPREKLISLINHFSTQVFDHSHVADDVFGNAYEYLIRSFASKAGKSSGEFYTPRAVAYLMAEIVEPRLGQTICDWASGSGGLLLQCRNYVARNFGAREADRVELYAQESNATTYNISRINMILHGVKSWHHHQGDSLRAPRLVDDQNNLLEFDRIVMNPPFSLENWGHDQFANGDPYGRLAFGMPPRDNGDYAWLQQVVKSLKADGKAVVVMSQGVLFRGQPQLTEETDGRNQRADAEYSIREAMIRADVIESIVVLPSKLFYGNNVPGCLVVFNKNKPLDRKGKILLIWASRHYEKSNPQNMLRPSDLMRVLVPWRAFGDPATAIRLVPVFKDGLVAEETTERDRRLADIESAYAPSIALLIDAEGELRALERAPFSVWKSAPTANHPVFGPLHTARSDARTIRGAVAEAKREYAIRRKLITRRIKELERLRLERDEQEAAVRAIFDTEIAHIEAAAVDLLSILADPDRSRRYFGIVDADELRYNEFNLSVPRYIDTWEPQSSVLVSAAASRLSGDETSFHELTEDLLTSLGVRVGAANAHA